MKEQDIQDILKHLPPEQHEEARYRITRAELDGVEAIGLCTGDEPPDVSDLMGNKEGESREMDMGEFGKVMINRWAIWLSCYKSK